MLPQEDVGTVRNRLASPSTPPADQAPADHAAPPSALTALLVDWGGVLTPPLDAAIGAWARRDGIEFDHFRDVMRMWVGAPRPDAPGNVIGGDEASGQGIVASVEQADDAGPAGQSPVHRVERGELAAEEFEDALAMELTRRGSLVNPRGLLSRMFADFDVLVDSMVGLIHRARRAGLKTALLSNSWTDDHYPAALFDDLFDALVISGRVGMRKPEPRIYAHAAHLLGVPPSACVLVDDLPHNVSGAVAAGMVGVLHTSYETTLAELEILFGVPLANPEQQR